MSAPPWVDAWYFVSLKQRAQREELCIAGKKGKTYIARTVGIVDRPAIVRIRRPKLHERKVPLHLEQELDTQIDIKAETA